MKGTYSNACLGGDQPRRRWCNRVADNFRRSGRVAVGGTPVRNFFNRQREVSNMERAVRENRKNKRERSNRLAVRNEN